MHTGLNKIIPNLEWGFRPRLEVLESPTLNNTFLEFLARGDSNGTVGLTPWPGVGLRFGISDQGGLHGYQRVNVVADVARFQR